MKGRIVRLTAAKKAAALCCFTVLCAVLLAFPQAAATGAKRGLAVCGNVLIPSLFPFMALSSFLVESGLAEAVGRRLEKVTAALFGLPGCCAAGILLSFVGGYPAGAAACAALVKSGRLTASDGRRMMRFCVVGGPAFVVGTVGVGMLGSTFHGWLLLLAQWAAALCIGVAGGRGNRKRSRVAPALPSRPLPLFSAVAAAVTNAARAMVVMSGFVTAVACFLSVLDGVGIPATVSDGVAAVAEVSVGCLAVSPRVVALAACIGFGGLSVHGQIGALFSVPVLDSGFFAARLCHAALAAVFTWLLFCAFPLSVPVFAANTVQITAFSCGFTGSAALLATFITALFSLPQKAA